MSITTPVVVSSTSDLEPIVPARIITSEYPSDLISPSPGSQEHSSDIAEQADVEIIEDQIDEHWAGTSDGCMPKGVSFDCWMGGSTSQRVKKAFFVAWKVDKENKFLVYGATIYKITINRGQRDTLDIDMHTDTALWRLSKMPIWIDNLSEKIIKEPLEFIKKVMLELGCHDFPLEDISSFPPRNKDDDLEKEEFLSECNTYIYDETTNTVSLVDYDSDIDSFVSTDEESEISIESQSVDSISSSEMRG